MHNTRRCKGSARSPKWPRSSSTKHNTSQDVTRPADASRALSHCTDTHSAWRRRRSLRPLHALAITHHTALYNYSITTYKPPWDEKHVLMEGKEPCSDTAGKRQNAWVGNGTGTHLPGARSRRQRGGDAKSPPFPTRYYPRGRNEEHHNNMENATKYGDDGNKILVENGHAHSLSARMAADTTLRCRFWSPRLVARTT